MHPAVSYVSVHFPICPKVKDQESDENLVTYGFKTEM